MVASRASLGPSAVLVLGGLLATACGPVDDHVDTPDAGRANEDTTPSDGGAADAHTGMSLQGLACADVKAQLSCGGSACSDLGAGGRDFCAVNCCTEDDRCGARVAVEGRVPGRCIEQPQPDERCPALDGELGRVEGCCTSDFECGVLLGPTCASLRDLSMRSGAQTPSPIDCDGNPLPPLGDDLDAGS